MSEKTYTLFYHEQAKYFLVNVHFCIATVEK